MAEARLGEERIGRPQPSNWFGRSSVLDFVEYVHLVRLPLDFVEYVHLVRLPLLLNL